MASSLLANAERLLQQLDWRVLKRLDGLLQGDARTLAYGRGLDFADLRDYQPHDDVRHIDWNATARFNEPHVRQFLEDRDHTAWFLLDRSASMSFGPADRSKGLVLAEFVGALALVLTRAGNRVGAMLWDDEVETTIPPALGRNQVLRIADELLRPAGKGRNATDLAQLLEAGRRAIRRRSLVIVASDFISTPGWEDELGALAHTNDVVTVRLHDPAESALPAAGIVALEDPETGDQVVVDTDDPKFRERYAAAASARDDEIERAILAAGADPYSLSTSEDLVLSIATMAHRRRVRR